MASASPSAAASRSPSPSGRDMDIENSTESLVADVAPVAVALDAAAGLPALSLCSLLTHEVRGVRDVSAHDFIKAYAAHLKRTGGLKVPKSAEYVKTAHFKELAPLDPDWFYVRSASVARQIYLRCNIGVGAMTRKHGGKKRRGSRPNVFARSSGSVDRRAMQALQGLGIVKVTAYVFCFVFLFFSFLFFPTSTNNL